LTRERAALGGFVALGNELYRAAAYDRWIAALTAQPATAQPAAWMYTLEYGEKVADTKVSRHQLNYPFGVCGADYLRRNDDGVSYVRQTPLYAAPPAAAQPVAHIDIRQLAADVWSLAACGPATPVVDRLERIEATLLAALAATPAAARAPLTDDRIKTVHAELLSDPDATWVQFARAIERAHGITAAGQEGGAA
jgi:hypothetical protein